LKIVSFITESFLEYQDYISLVLFSYGCNFKCSYCYNYDFVTNPKNIINKDLTSVIESNLTPLTDALVFLGGEPTIYGDELLEISSFVKSQYNLKVKVFTNGSNPELICNGVRLGLFDSVSLDIKSYYSPIPEVQLNTSFDVYKSNLDRIMRFFLEENRTKDLEVRTTVVKSNEHEVERIESLCLANGGIKFIKQRDVRKSYQEILLHEKSSRFIHSSTSGLEGSFKLE